MTFSLYRSVLSLFLIALLLALAACDRNVEPQDSATVFLKAEPAVDGVLEFAPGSLRVFFNELPRVAESSMSLTGPEGDVSLSGLHTMGADDLMIGIDRYPLPPGDYTVHWTARFKEKGPAFSDSYNFTIKARH